MSKNSCTTCQSCGLGKWRFVPLLIMAAVLVIVAAQDTFAFDGVTITELRTVPIDDKGTYSHSVEICAGSERVRSPPLKISSDTETFGEQAKINLPPGFCGYLHFIISAKDPISITAELVQHQHYR